MAFLDQALFAGSHFVLHILVSRWMTPDEYGAFATAYALFLLIAAAQGALFAEPMMVFGSGRFRTRFRGYFRRLLRVHLLVAAGAFIGLGAGALAWWTAGDRLFGGALLGAAMGGFLLLHLWLIRRAHFTLLTPGWAAGGGLLYFLILVGALWVLKRMEVLTAMTTFLTMGAGAAVVALILVVPLMRGKEGSGSEAGATEILLAHWEYGRWSLPTVGPVWVTTNGYFLLLPWLEGLEAAGSFRALLNLIMPAAHTFLALSLFLLPVLSLAAQESGVEGVSSRVRRVIGWFLAAAAIYFLVLAITGEWLIASLYDGQYEEHGLLNILFIGGLPFAYAIDSVLVRALLALERPDVVFRAYATSAAVSVVMGIPMVWHLEVLGAVLTIVTASFTAAVALAWGFRNIDEERFIPR